MINITAENEEYVICDLVARIFDETLCQRKNKRQFKEACKIEGRRLYDATVLVRLNYTQLEPNNPGSISYYKKNDTFFVTYTVADYFKDLLERPDWESIGKKKHIAVTEERRVLLKCDQCGREWSGIVRSGKPVSERLLSCPQGCNTPSNESAKIQEVNSYDV